MKKIDKKQRIIIFIDNSNLFHSFQKLNFHCDYKKLKNVIINDRELVDIFLYTGIMYPVKRGDKAFLSKLSHLGFNVKTRAVKVTPSGIKKEKRIDVLMAVDMISSAYEKNYDIVVLVSGDGDFVPVLKKLKELGRNIEVWSFKDLLSTQIKNEFGEENCFYIDDILDKLAF